MKNNLIKILELLDYIIEADFFISDYKKIVSIVKKEND